jgi:hypothetical protein
VPDPPTLGSIAQQPRDDTVRKRQHCVIHTKGMFSFAVDKAAPYLAAEPALPPFRWIDGLRKWSLTGDDPGRVSELWSEREG